MIKKRQETPRYWVNEISGSLRPAVIAYLHNEDLTTHDIVTLRAYFRQWIAGDFKGPYIDVLRTAVDGLTSREAIKRWLDLATEQGLDPL